MTPAIKLGTQPSKHLYEVETKVDGNIVKIDVHADTRTQATKLAKAAGYEVRSVNMVG